MGKKSTNESNQILAVTAVAVVGAGLLLRRKWKPFLVDRPRLNNYVRRIRVTMPAMRFKGDNVEFDMYVQNPNPDQLTVNAIVGDMYMSYKGKVLKIGNVFKYGDVIIKPLQETKFTFSVRLKFLPLLIYFQDLLDGKATGQILTFKGTITVDRMPWPIKESLKIS
jgi:hypothetical protein